jgi:tRNA(fMet)-specific endonuclease VapC
MMAMPSSACSQCCSTNQDSPDIFSEILKGVNQNVVASATRYHSTFGYYTISVITVLEIVKGFHKLNREDRVQQFLAGLPAVELLTLDQRSAERAGRIYTDLERVGQPIGRADPMIAAIALRYDFTRVTGNLSHYQRIQALGYGIKLDNWRV